MATCNYIKAKKQNQSAMRAVIRYVSQDAKTLDENGHRYLSGINCIGAAAYDEFMATKNLYGKRSGVYYYHYEQSFAPGEIEDYDTAHKIGLRLAEEMFPGFEVLVGTHLDAHDDDGRQSEPRRQELGEQYRTESAGSAEGEQRNSLTGWEDARAIFLSAEHRNGQSDGSFLGYDFRDEEVDHGLDSGYGNRKRVVKRDDLSIDEITSFFADERNLYDDMPFDEEDMDADNPLNQLQAEARNGNVYAMYRLARLYLDENNRFYNESIGDYYLEKAAKAGHSVAQYRMGKMFYYGIIYREDEYEAQKWLSESVGNGNKCADALLGKLYVESELFGKFRNEGFDHLFKAERNGSEFAAYTLGKYYMDGKHVKKDIAKAIEHLEIASARGNMYADYRLAQIYLFEADIFDMKKALEYLNRSAHAGNESAALALTRMANNQFLAVATNVLDLVGSLASIESYRQPQDCTTMPISRKERKKHEWEQSM